MRIILTLPDSIAEKYQDYAERQTRPTDEVMVAQLTRFAPLEPGKKAIVIRAEALKGLEAKLGNKPIATGEQLEARIMEFAGVSFMHRDLGLSLQQLKELEHRAARQGKSVDQLLDQMHKVFVEQFFYSAGGGEAFATAGQPAKAKVGG